MTKVKMRSAWKSPWAWLAIVVAWRFLLLLAALPVPGNDAFLFDGAVVNWLRHGQYFNPSLAECFPISGHQVFAAYPPIYQALLLPWMSVFGTSALATMWFHFLWFCIAGVLLVQIFRYSFLTDANATPIANLALLFLCAVTFDDRPEGIAHTFGLFGLWLTVKGLSARCRLCSAGVVLALFCSLYTSLVVGAFYCAVAILTRVAAWLLGRDKFPWQIAAGTLALSVVTAFWIIKVHPLWWQGFLENARQTPVSTAGFRLPQPSEVVKVIRNAPVFLAGLLCVPWLFKRWLQLVRGNSQANSSPVEGPWIVDCLVAAVLAAGWILVTATLTLFTANYVIYLWYTQVLLAAGLIGLAAGLPARQRHILHGLLACCLMLVSIRAVGLSSWGVLCATDVSYHQARKMVSEELHPYSGSDGQPIVSSAFLYEAARQDVRGAIHSDWPYDRRGLAAGSDLALISRLRPPKLVLTEFDYYRVYAPILAELARHPELCSIKLRNTAHVPVPDSVGSLRRVLQHISWAPVIVDLEWKYATR